MAVSFEKIIDKPFLTVTTPYCLHSVSALHFRILAEEDWLRDSELKDFSVAESVVLSQFPESSLLRERLWFVLIFKSNVQKLILFETRKTGAQIIEEHWLANSIYKASYPTTLSES